MESLIEQRFAKRWEDKMEEEQWDRDNADGILGAYFVLNELAEQGQKDWENEQTGRSSNSG